MVIHNVAGLGEFTAGKMNKVTLAAGGHLYAGLNCFQPGQEHQAHTHADQDKLYLVLAGSGEAQVGTETAEVSAGDLVFAPAGVLHGMKNRGPEPLTVLVIFGPPPKQK